MLDLDQSILERHSTRMFLPRPVPQELVEQPLALAQHAPSNSNIQPWRLVFVSGTARNRLKDALFKVADREAPHIPALPKAFEHYRYQSQGAVLEVVFLEAVDHAQPALLNNDRLGLGVFLSPVPSDEPRLAVVAVNLERAIAGGRLGEREPGLRIRFLPFRHLTRRG